MARWHGTTTCLAACGGGWRSFPVRAARIKKKKKKPQKNVDEEQKNIRSELKTKR